MKKIFAIAIATTMLSTPAFAQSQDSEDLNISATVARECSIATPSAVSFASININQDPGATALMIDGNSNASQNVYVSCNYATTLAMSGAPLTNSAGASVAANDASDFTNQINYFVTLEPTSGSPFSKVTLNTRVASSASTTAAGAFHDNAKLGVTVTPGDNNAKRPVAGDYTAVTTITLGVV